MKVKLIAIAALGKNRELGLAGKLPWNIPAEYQHFLDTIKDQYVLVGRKNFEAHGGDIKGAYPLVLSRTQHDQNEQAIFFGDLLEVLSYAEDTELEKIYVIGGAEIYHLTLPYLSEFLWTEVDYQGPADVYFPDFSAFHWNKLYEQSHQGWKLRHLMKIPQSPY
jgi:dihydrofolate reductase